MKNGKRGYRCSCIWIRRMTSSSPSVRIVEVDACRLRWARKAEPTRLAISEVSLSV